MAKAFIIRYTSSFGIMICARALFLVFIYNSWISRDSSKLIHHYENGNNIMNKKVRNECMYKKEVGVYGFCKAPWQKIKYCVGK